MPRSAGRDTSLRNSFDNRALPKSRYSDRAVTDEDDHCAVFAWQQPGVEVEVHSTTGGGWVRGKVVPPAKAGQVTVRFQLGDSDTVYQKNFLPDSENLRQVSSSCRGKQNPKFEATSFLSSVPLFKTLPEEEFAILADSCSQMEFSKGQVLIRQGDPGESFSVLVCGSMKVDIDGDTVATLKSGDYFGENSLIHAVPCNATVTALSEGLAFRITRNQFEALDLREKLNFPQRHAVFGGHACQQLCRPPKTKNDNERKFLLKAILANTNLQSFLLSDNAKCHMMVDAAWKEFVPSGEKLILEGDLEADCFYIVEEGTFEVSTRNGFGITSSTKITKGGSFGELALLHFQPRAATVVADSDATVWVIDRQRFQQILSQSTEERAKLYARLLNNTIFASCNEGEKMNIAQALIEATFTEGENIIEQGEVGDAFYILQEGSVAVEQNGKRIDCLEKGSIFGERALLTNEARAATIVVTSRIAKVLWMDKDSFKALLPHFAIAGKFDPPRRSRTGSMRCSQGRIKQCDLKSFGLLGCGGFGAVELVEHKVTKALFALKALSKGYVVKCSMQDSVMSEKSIQLLCDSPFIVKLYETYNGNQSLYFLLELAAGGEVHTAYGRKGFYGSKRHAQYYVASAALAFQHVHSLKVIHRDLKPENLLLKDNGRAKLADFGLAKVVTGKTYTTCGTPEYFAPELIAHTGHTSAVDWWTVGILTYELMIGQTPFSAKSPPQIYAKVTKGIDEAHFPEKMESDFIDFVKRLCDKDPSLRLPVRKGGIENIKMHAWYSGFDWNGMQSLTLEPPYEPSAKDPTQLVHKNLKMPPQVTYTDDNSGWDEGFESISS